MPITYWDEKSLDAYIVCEFFNRFATWKVHPQPQQWEQMLSNSCAVISAWDEGSLIALARGIGDQVRYAQVLDVLVHPGYRRQGIGAEVVKRLVMHPSMQVRAVILGTPSMREFYQSVGFQCVNDRAYFMVLVRDEFGKELIQPVDE